VLAGRGEETLLLVEHPPVITLGRSGSEADLGLTAAQWAKRGIEVYAVDRGGKATYHGPGQVVAYPILDLRRRGRDLRAYVHALEDGCAAAVRRFGPDARPGRDPVGVFVGDAKIASLGVSVSRWITQHGLALNVTSDLAVYRWFTPCGLEGVPITRLADLAPVGFEEAKAALAEELIRKLQG
jgi:lipoate-protein ligase B